MGLSNIFSFFNRGNTFGIRQFQSEYTLIGNNSPKWIDINRSDLWNVFCDVPHVNLVINKKASMMANMRILHYDRNGELIENSPFVKLLQNPNPINNGVQSIKDIIIAKSVFSNSFQYMNKLRSSDAPVGLWVLPPEMMSIELTGKSLDQTKKEEIIKKYRLDQNGAGIGLFADVRDFEPNEIIHLKDNLKSGDAVGTPKFEALVKPISNIVQAYEARNILITERGAIGILSSEAKDGIPMNKKEKKKIREALNEEYGITRGPKGRKKSTKIVTTSPVKWQPMNFNVDQLRLFEEVDDDFRVICDTFGMLINAFSSQKGTTFENQKEANKSIYQNTIIPESIEIMQEYSNAFGISEKGEYLVADFSHVSILQENKAEKAKAMKNLADAMKVGAELVQNGVITQDRFDEMFRL